MIAKVFEHPFDLIKVRLQSQPLDRPARFLGPIDCFKQTLAGEGFLGLYRVGAFGEDYSNKIDTTQRVFLCL